VSNLSDLLPAGASAKQITATDSGSGIASKAPVVLNSDGTVAEVSQSSVTEAVGTEALYYTSTMYQTATTFDSTNNRGVFVYRNQGTPFYVRCVIGTVNGTSAMTYGTEVVVNSVTNSYQPTVVFDSNAGKVVIFYLETSNLIGIVGTVDPSDNSISFGSPVTVSTVASTGPNGGPLAVFDTTNNQILVVFSDSTDNSPRGRVVTVSGTSLTLGTEAGIGGASDGWFGLTYDSGSNNIIFAFQDYSSSYYASCMVGSISSSAPSFPGLVYAFDSSGISGMIDCSYDSTANKTVFVWRDGGQSNRGKAIVGTVTGATSITFGAEVDVNSGRADYLIPIYDPIANKTIVLYSDYNYPAVNNYYGRLVVGTISGTNLTFDSAVDFHASGTLYITGAYDSTSNVILINYQDQGNASQGAAKIYRPASTPTNLTAQAFVGIADSAISASAAGSIIVQGGTVAGVNSGQGFTVGTPSTFGGGVSIGSPAMAYDTVHDKMVIAYADNNNSSYGTVVVATIGSDSSISYGTQVVFESGSTEHIDVCFDPDQERVIIAYRDSPNSDYGTVIAGEVSGTSITFGSPVVYSAATTQNVNCVYDTSNDKVVIVYYDVSNTGLKAIVGTVSGSSISLGTPTTIVANATWPGVKAVFDSTANKIVVVYANQTNGDSDGVVGTVSGTSISFGSIVQFESGSASPLTAAYDASADKTLVVYGDAGNSDYGTSVVASVSGTSISFTSPSVFETSQPGVVKSVYDATAQQTFIAYQDYSASYIGVARAVSISGTTATFSGKTTLVDPNPSPFNLGYDPDNGKTIFAFYETTGQALVTSYGDIPLTTGTKYFVTPSGGFSSTAGSPSVNAGLAISTTSLLLNGDS
jgi:hypothetical protein